MPFLISAVSEESHWRRDGKLSISQRHCTISTIYLTVSASGSYNTDRKTLAVSRYGRSAATARASCHMMLALALFDDEAEQVGFSFEGKVTLLARKSCRAYGIMHSKRACGASACHF
jgi:hypothetical protein